MKAQAQVIVATPVGDQKTTGHRPGGNLTSMANFVAG